MFQKAQDIQEQHNLCPSNSRVSSSSNPLPQNRSTGWIKCQDPTDVTDVFTEFMEYSKHL